MPFDPELDTTTNPSATPASQLSVLRGILGATSGTLADAFDLAAAPTVTSGAYSAGDIMGALMEFEIGFSNGVPIIIDSILITFKSAVAPSLTAVIFNADPTATTKTDNAAYSLNSADAFKVRGTLPINALGGYMVDHGTPNTFQLGNLGLVIKPASDSKKVYLLLIDNTGVTLTSTSDLQVVLQGRGA